MTEHTALIVDDEPDIRELMALTLSRMNIDTFAAENLAQAQQMLQDRRYDLCLTDLKLPDGTGLSLVSHMQEHFPDTPIAVITAHGNMESAVQALKDGAFDFVSKPIDLGLLRKLVNNALQLKQFPEADRRTRHILLGESPAMKTTRSMIAKVARSQAPVYISGESGTGKELVARLIHQKGPHPEQPFVPVNCGAIPTELMESEFFGHKKGSFTGAVTDKAGLFHAAHGGTLFLDEVADLPLHMQVKLLRAIQEKAVRPVGEQKEIPIDVRILAATHKDLAALVQEGRFRQDLYYRLNVIELRVPALRERSDDIPQLTDHILSRLAQQNEVDKPSLSESALQALQSYNFPGNVRELENILERAMTLCEDNIIQPQDLQLPNLGQSTLDTSAALTVESGLPLEEHLEAIERELINNALEKARYNKTAAAKLLGISFRALRYRLKKLGME